MSEVVKKKNQLQEAFHAQSEAAVFTKMASSDHGLSTKEANNRLKEYGLNVLDEGKKVSVVKKFLNQFKDLMIVILLISAFFSVVINGGEDISDAIIILVVVMINAVFGVFQESKAETAIDALKSMSTPLARVRRDGNVEEIRSEKLVPGDVVLLEAGDVVPADMRLFEAASLKIEEAALTGESVPVEKNIYQKVNVDASIGDRFNMAFQNANVTYGRGVGVVVATGMNTEVGKIADMLVNFDETQTPLKQNLNRLSKVLTIAILLIAVITFLVYFLRGGEPFKGLMTSVALAVAAIPEGLPAIVTIILALGTQILAKRNSIMRKLSAVETLGSTQIIASDKTGTLTMNQMRVEKIYTNEELKTADDFIDLSDMTLKVMNYANDTKIAQNGSLIGDPTEMALIQFGIDHQYDLPKLLQVEPRVAELPFDSDRKLMSTVHKLADGNFLVAVKGAPDQLIKRVTKKLVNWKITFFTKKNHENIVNINHFLAKNALRVLAFGYKIVSKIPELKTNSLESDLIFAGLVGMIDPERKEAKEAVRVAKLAGIYPIMITGDHQDTAEAIALRLDILDKDSKDTAVLTGSELNELTDEEFQKQVKQYAVYARVSPDHKVRIVKAWQNAGKVVAMTGDGVNDAPALKMSDIGIGMGITGTEVSKSASDMVLADDNFATIIVAIKEGRKIFANIQKTIQYLLSANMAEVLTIFLATLFGWGVLMPVHLLWINLVTDTFPAIALGVESAEPKIMEQKPRGRAASFFSKGVLGSIIYQGILQGVLTLSVYGAALIFPAHTLTNFSYKEAILALKNIGEGVNKSLTHVAAIDQLQHADALTMAFATLGLIQLFHAFNVKSVHQSILTVGAFYSKTFNWSILISFLLLALTIVIPSFNKTFHVAHLDLYQWGIVFIAGLLMILIVEAVKVAQRKILDLTDLK
ncbi:MAG: cation-translocating P-type ATPase [Streptococcaceae bacterium]|jgi:Ca2+-transporting ATPase|nr:cation-translocating P-type ATPase [Streptococcaceae bacterium]